jgi:hypothetical protein
LDENFLNGVISVKIVKLGGKNWNLLFYVWTLRCWIQKSKHPKNMKSAITKTNLLLLELDTYFRPNS